MSPDCLKSHLRRKKKSFLIYFRFFNYHKFKYVIILYVYNYGNLSISFSNIKNLWQYTDIGFIILKLYLVIKLYLIMYKSLKQLNITVIFNQKYPIYIYMCMCTYG